MSKRQAEVVLGAIAVRGILRFTDELIARVNRAGASGAKLMRADSGFQNQKVFARLEQAGWQYSIGVKMSKHVRDLVDLIDEMAWTTITGYPDIRDLKDQALAHFPSGRFNANGAWTVIAAIAHNLLRWTELLGHADHIIRAARTVRRRLFALPGRLTTHAARWTLHLPARWPWKQDFTDALERIRALPAAA